jgi:hypothetical protein
MSQTVQGADGRPAYATEPLRSRKPHTYPEGDLE